MIYVNNITKIFKTRKREVVANKDITFHIEKGEILGILGPNGAGKTTLIKQIATLLIPDKGDIYYKGTSIVKHPEVFRGKFAFLMEGTRNVYHYLTGRANLVYFALLHKVPKKVAEKKADELLERMGLKDVADEWAIKYSTGMLKKLSIAATLIHNPEVIFLDEPLSGLDVIARTELENTIREIVKDKNITFIISSHRMEFIENITERVIWLKDGRIVKIGRTEEIKMQSFSNLYEIYFKYSDKVIQMLKAWKIDYEIIGGNVIKCRVKFEKDGVFQRLVSQQEVLSIEKVERDFENIFKELYG